jgi:hypothetical protein
LPVQNLGFAFLKTNTTKPPNKNNHERSLPKRNPGNSLMPAPSYNFHR